ncbi:MAG: hypothetical protein BWY07_01984 [Candidatus Hydrogenedentes bacterium ADurb.Bin170]|nr:MAG: hypothetical protein BWY07_01984 [Candidatus Hydrogenedentes bacterium ADurb.Bin170]
MLSGLSGLSGLQMITDSNKSQPLPEDSAWRMRFTPSAAVDLSELQLAIDNSDLLNGAVGIVQEANAVTLTGKASRDFEAAALYESALLDIVNDFTAPVVVSFEADLQGQASTTSTGSSSSSSSSSGLPDTIMGIKTHYLLIAGAAALIFFSQSKGGK